MVASRLSNIHGGGGPELASARRLRLENERLVAEVARLRRLLLSGASRGEVGADDAAMEEEARFVALEMELQHAKEALQALKADRKRLKAEKFDLLNQMKALYGTLEDKERELRDFIRNYEQVSDSRLWSFSRASERSLLLLFFPLSLLFLTTRLLTTLESARRTSGVSRASERTERKK